LTSVIAETLLSLLIIGRSQLAHTQSLPFLFAHLGGVANEVGEKCL